MTVSDFTLRSTIERNRQFYFERYGKLDWQWTDEGLIWAIQDYHSCKGSVEAFTDDDWSVVKENGLTKETVIEFCESEDDE